jgi:hypothetical protein
MNKKKILFCITDSGGGHRSVANSIKDHIGDSYEIKIINIYVDVFKTKGEILYNKLILEKCFTRLYWPILVPYLKLNLNLRRRKLIKQLSGVWKQENPDLIISLMPFVNALVATSIKRTIPHCQFWICMTDMINPENSAGYWFCNCDRLLVPTQKAFEQAQSSDYHFSDINLLNGIIINKKYVYHKCNKKLNDFPQNKIVISFGKYCSIKRVGSLTKLISLNFPTKTIIVLCGTNNKLKECLITKNYNNVKAIGFTQKAQDFFANSDLLIGKPGPTTISEALILKTYVLCDIRGIMKQEIATVNFLKEYPSYGSIFAKPADLIKKIVLFYSKPKKNINYSNTALFEFAHILQSFFD